MWLAVLYALGVAATTAGMAYRSGRAWEAGGRTDDDVKRDNGIALALLVGILWFPALFTYMPRLLGEARGRADKDARVRAALHEQEYARLEEDAREEVAKVLAMRGRE